MRWERGSQINDVLPIDHPTAVAFLDESGSISKDRYFAVGCLKLADPNWLLRQVQYLRDQYHWYQEIHFLDLTRDALPFYRLVVDVMAQADSMFSCFVSDRNHADPITRFGGPFEAYESLACQLLMGSIRRRELVTVLADRYSSPMTVRFEESVKARVNRRLGRLALTSVVRLDSRAADPLQLADLLTSAVAFEFRQASGLAGKNSPKAQLAAYVRATFGVDSFLSGCRTNQVNVQVYREARSILREATAP